MKDYDSIVIGGGIGGLVAAGRLVSVGQRVLVLEKNRIAGGYLQSFKRRGFTFDSCVDCFSGLDKEGPIRSILDGLGITRRVETIRLDPVRLSLFPDFKVTVHADIDSYIKELSTLFPREVSEIWDLFDVMRLIYGDIMGWSDYLVGR
ncbi:MAG: NAD(P)-binding protein, partial [Deltaproteobacteria bacterium]|nr:NAD(P)-binding protein [Deltaproteobacteria bacterium]